MARTSKRICAAQGHAPWRKPPDTAHGRKDLPPRRNTPLGESIPTRRTGKRICAAQEHAPRRRPPDTAHGRKGLPHAGTRPTAKASRHGARAKGFARARTLPSAKASRHGARAKEFAPRRNTPHGEGLPTRRKGKRICPAREHAPWRRPPDTAHERKDLPRGVRVCPTCRRTAGRPRPTDSRKTPLRRGRTHSVRPLPSSFTEKKIRLLHETQLFYGESHVGSPQIFPSFPSVGRCVARERNPVPPVAPHRGSEHRGLRRTGEMVRRFDAMCPRGGEWLPRGGNGWPCGGRCDPGLRCFGERFHRRRCANPDACRGRRCTCG